MKAAAAILAITALSFFVFPGHTYLQQDTQIYVPILENQWTGALASDLLVERPHVNFTLYDELTDALRWLTHSPLGIVLPAEQLFFRACGFAGVYLIALSFGLDAGAAILVVSLAALGATIVGPAVLTIEYEPTPRAFAVPLLLLATGLAMREKHLLAGLAAASAVLLHAPTVWPFLVALACLSVVQRRALGSFLPIALAGLALGFVGVAQSVHEPQRLFSVLPAGLESLQRMRASYNYVTTWWTAWIGQYILFAAIAVIALYRVQAERKQWAVFLGFLVSGLASVPVSALLLEHYKLSIIPQLQPARALLFVTETSIIVSAIAGCFAFQRKRRVESAVWFAFTLWNSANVSFFLWPPWPVLATIAALAILLATVRAPYRPLFALLPAIALAIPAGIVNYRAVESPDLQSLAAWARSSTPAGAVFAFPQAGRDRSPGWFRATALRAVYVDWKGGGQLNYLQDFGFEWWRRWQAVMTHPATIDAYRALHIDFIVLPRTLPGAAHAPEFRNGTYLVYSTSLPL